MLAALALSMGLVATPVAEPGERNIFRLPQADDVRMQQLTRAKGEKGWPFTVDEGLLMCLYAAGMPLVMFAVQEGETASGEPNIRLVTLSHDPFEAVFSNIAVNDLIVRTATPKERIAMFSSYVDLGKRLCEQPRGTQLGPGEL